MRMTRRGFLAFLGTATVSAREALAAPLDLSPGVVVLECFVAGLRFHAGPGYVVRVRPGDGLTPIPEPGNVHDRFAVRLMHGDTMLGYLPRQQNEPISRLLAGGAEVRARVTAVDPDARPWQAIRLAVRLKVPGGL